MWVCDWTNECMLQCLFVRNTNVKFKMKICNFFAPFFSRSPMFYVRFVGCQSPFGVVAVGALEWKTFPEARIEVFFCSFYFDEGVLFVFLVCLTGPHRWCNECICVRLIWMISSLFATTQTMSSIFKWKHTQTKLEIISKQLRSLWHIFHLKFKFSCLFVLSRVR